MPENVLLSGPAGAGKSQAARELLRTGKVDLVADFQSILAALMLLERGQDGRYPQRDRAAEKLIPLAQAVPLYDHRRGAGKGPGGGGHQ